jgi:hypothetical protein
MRTDDGTDGGGVEFKEILAWVSDHGQSLDWLFIGDPSIMIVRLARGTPGRQQMRLLEEV